jgi:hypothetical protein
MGAGRGVWRRRFGKSSSLIVRDEIRRERSFLYTFPFVSPVPFSAVVKATSFLFELRVFGHSFVVAGLWELV